MTLMARAEVAEATQDISQRYEPHAGLVLDRCLPEWSADATKKGEAFANFIKDACGVRSPALYEQAYQRWRALMLARVGQGCAALWCGKLDGRLFLGTGGVSPLEAAITLHRTYGTPSIPGSALKGLARAFAWEQVDGEKRRVAQAHFEVLFGREPGGTGDEWDGGDAGYVVFHDAWWIPNSAKSPLVPEIVTVHHPDYYGRQGARPATDFDSPTPNAQVAAQGSFLFCVEAPDGWAGFALKLLRAALEDWGAGAKTAAGYGYFVEDEGASQALAQEGKKRLRDSLSGEERLRAELRDWDEQTLAESLGKHWNKRWADIEQRFPAEKEVFPLILDEIWGDQLREWESRDKNSNFHKAHKRWKRLLQGEAP